MQGDCIIHCKDNSFGLDLHHICGDMKSWLSYSKNSKVNILLFGWAGAGKSSLYNAFQNIFLEEPQYIAPVLSSSEHVTQRLTNYGDNSLDNFIFWDTKGLTLNNYNDEEFDDIMRGSSSMYTKMNLVIFVMPQSCRDDTSIMERLKRFVTDVKLRELEPFLVITHADELIFNDYDPVKQSFRRRLELPSNRIYLLDLSTIERNFERDRTIYDVLDSCMDFLN